jgi:hypothetical protein
MNIYFYKKTHTREHLERVCELAGTKISWFELCMGGHGEFSAKTAIALEAVTRALAVQPDDYLTAVELLNIDDLVKEKMTEIEESLKNTCQS